jgi:hypothetical protein
MHKFIKKSKKIMKKKTIIQKTQHTKIKNYYNITQKNKISLYTHQIKTKKKKIDP